jgi:hypothetical protein
MQCVKSQHRGGVIGVISGDLARYTSFATSMLRLHVPGNSAWAWHTGNGFASLRNHIVREMEPDVDWLFFMDDDHTFYPDILLRLLDRNVDIIQPLVSTRKPPYRPYGYMHDGQDYRSMNWSDFPLHGIKQVDAVGTGGMLVRRKVLDAVGDPWFEEGRTGKEHLGEDLHFCTKARGKGFQVFVDCDVRMGHMATVQVWPDQAEQKVETGQKLDWCVKLELDHCGLQLPTNFGQGVIQEA